ncbi:hypothetical protein CCUS01_07307 [Colletotrichum cuscutae]|uniref:ABC transmembrane type-1 domain-containing protein n=1 Tax=Colletotrichum cuscutae TaxID=1209917 RepID=A0AAI9Y0Q5_9PEZI|nr:hypothetical protein CCUS01_07307 [Colletotrichum cuscutae]
MGLIHGFVQGARGPGVCVHLVIQRKCRRFQRIGSMSVRVQHEGAVEMNAKRDDGRRRSGARFQQLAIGRARRFVTCDELSYAIRKARARTGEIRSQSLVNSGFLLIHVVEVAENVVFCGFSGAGGAVEDSWIPALRGWQAHGKRMASAWQAHGRRMAGARRVFKYGEPIDYALEAVGILAAIASGVALAMMNLIIGGMMNLMSDFSSITADPDKFMAKVSKNALYFVYIGIARFATTYVYSALFTYVAFKLTRNVRRTYLQAALSQEISFFDHGTAGSIAMQATTNGKLIQSGIAEKLGLFFSSISTFVAAFIIAFVSQWKLTLIISCIVPAIIVVSGGMAALDSGLETKILQINAEAGTYAESALGSIRAIKAFSLESRIMHKYSSYLGNSRAIGAKKSPIYGVMFGWQYFIVYAGMALAFWQGIAMIARKEVDGVGTVFTVLFSVIIASISINGIAPHIMAFSRAATSASELFGLIDRHSEINPFDETGKVPDCRIGNYLTYG